MMKATFDFRIIGPRLFSRQETSNDPPANLLGPAGV